MESNFSTNRHSIICGDLNAHVGHCDSCDEYSGVLGPNAPFSRNDRGEMLLQWCSGHNFIISNTMQQTDISSAWTFRGNSSLTQVDYILMSARLIQLLKCVTLDMLDIGSDHRPLRATFSFSTTASKCDVPKTAVSRNYRKREYQAALDNKLNDSDMNSDPRIDGETRSCKLEQAMISALHSAQTVRREHARTDTDLVKIRALIKERRRSCHLRSTPYYKSLCKQIQKLTRQRDRSLKAGKIKRILENFRGLKNISHIKANG